jgi:signal transduction histidine kinase
MARQVAHEIKNPLTPIRLGVQHLRRAYRDGRSDFGAILDTNVTRVLAEIDHLDEIARAFSRYGMAPDQRAPATAVDVVAVIQDVIELERMGEGDVQWSLAVPESASLLIGQGQRDELKEVLLNLLENARLAHARTVSVSVSADPETVRVDVQDDGQGIAADVLPHVFEPHFSTRTSGSGLGLAISRRLIEGWGGRISLESTPGIGTIVHVQLRIG